MRNMSVLNREPPNPFSQPGNSLIPTIVDDANKVENDQYLQKYIKFNTDNPNQLNIVEKKAIEELAKPLIRDGDGFEK